MQLLRSRPPAADTDRDLSTVPLSALLAELRARGVEAFPAGVWAWEIGWRDRELGALLAARAVAEERERDKVDAGPVIAELRDLAGVTLPQTARELQKQLTENTRLSGRAARAERETELLASALMRDELEGLASDREDD